MDLAGGWEYIPSCNSGGRTSNGIGALDGQLGITDGGAGWESGRQMPECNVVVGCRGAVRWVDYNLANANLCSAGCPGLLKSQFICTLKPGVWRIRVIEADALWNFGFDKVQMER